MSACPGVDMRELGLFAGQQGGPKYEQPSSDVPLHQASRAGKIKKKSVCFLRHLATHHHDCVEAACTKKTMEDGPQPDASHGSGISKSHLHQTSFLRGMFLIIKETAS